MIAITQIIQNRHIFAAIYITKFHDNSHVFYMLPITSLPPEFGDIKIAEFRYGLTAMQSQTYWHSPIIEALSGQIMVSGRMTLADRYQIRSALLNDSLSEADQVIINRLLYGVRHGLVRIVN